jgi:hypothetical protein
MCKNFPKKLVCGKIPEISKSGLPKSGTMLALIQKPIPWAAIPLAKDKL